MLYRFTDNLRNDKQINFHLAVTHSNKAIEMKNGKQTDFAFKPWIVYKSYLSEALISNNLLALSKMSKELTPMKYKNDKVFSPLHVPKNYARPRFTRSKLQFKSKLVFT